MTNYKKLKRAEKLICKAKGKLLDALWELPIEHQKKFNAEGIYLAIKMDALKIGIYSESERLRLNRGAKSPEFTYPMKKAA